MDGLTDTQLRVYRYLEAFYGRNGYYATVRDVQEFIGWRSATTAYECIDALCNKNFVLRKKITRDRIVFVANTQV